MDAKIKRQATKIFSDLGLDMSTGIKIYLAKVVSEKGVPFAMLTENGFTPEQEKRMLADMATTERAYRSGRRKPARSMAELKRQLLA